MFAWVRGLFAPHAVPRSEAVTPAQIGEFRQQLSDVRAWLAELESRIERASAAPKAAPLSVDEQIAEADTATRVYKALEPELGVDRRTILARVERLVKAHSLAERFPNWGTDVALAKYLAERVGDERRISVAIRELGKPLEAGA
jgi:hypothetical protein